MGNIHDTNGMDSSKLTTFVITGEGYGIVIRTGDQTVLGQIAGMTDGEEKRPSPMSVEIDNLVKFTAFIASLFAIVFFIVGFKVYPNIASNVNFAIGMLVAFVPQGLPATVSVSKPKTLHRHILLHYDLMVSSQRYTVN